MFYSPVINIMVYTCISQARNLGLNIYVNYMIGYAIHLMANAVHPSGAPEVQHGLHSTLDG